MWHIYLSVLLFILKAENLCGNGDWLAAARAKDSAIAFRQFLQSFELLPQKNFRWERWILPPAKSRNRGQSKLLCSLEWIGAFPGRMRFLYFSERAIAPSER